MKYICHRGRLEGENSDLDNNPEQIKYCINKGFDVEIDLWVIGDQLLLGHDYPNYLIPQEFLFKNYRNLWVHCKNFDALVYCNYNNLLNYFWHQEDDYTLTSRGFIWTYPGKVGQYANQVILDFSKTPDFTKYKNLNYYGICFDYIEDL